MYAELHLHTAYSFLDGASLPGELVERAVELGYKALAITDHDGVHGAMEFAQLAQAAGITPLTGAEITLADGSHLTLLAKSVVGYGNLCRLLTHFHHGRAVAVEGPHPPALPPPDLPRHGGGASPKSGEGGARPPLRQRSRLREKEPSSFDPPLPRTGGGVARSAGGEGPPLPLGAYAEGLILLTGCRHGQLARLVDADRLAEATALLRQYVEWFGWKNVVVELQQNRVHGDTRRVERLVALADKLGLRYAATGNVHYHRPERHRLQDIVVAIRHRTTLDGCHRERRANAEFFLRAPAEMARLFARYPEAIRTTELLAERCAGFNLTTDLRYTFPDYETETGESPDTVLARVCWEAYAGRYGRDDAEARGRLAEELRLIARHQLSGFFLIYRDLLELGREVAAELRGGCVEPDRSRRFLPPGRGRGSSVSSIVCYLIGLTPVDPLKHDLYVGRFLNDELPSVPDIDIDFPRGIRERLIERVYEVYGPERAALVCAFSTYKLRSAVRDVGKALGLPLPDLDRIAKLSEPRSATELAGELARLPEYAARMHVPPWSHLVELAGQLADFPRHVTQHVGGMIVSAKPLTELVPIQPAAMEGRYICQWDKDSVDDAGFIKIDFLALGMLSLVEECLDLIDARSEVGSRESGVGSKDSFYSRLSTPNSRLPGPVDLGRIDFADPAVYKMIRAGDTVGVFQIESRAQIQMLRRTKPANLNDLVIQVAIVRPGPIIGGAVTPYVARREDPHYVPVYDHPCLEPLLRETLGVILYQEQVVQVAEALAGFSAGQADQVRRAMTRKRSAEAMEQMREEFIVGAWERHGIPRAKADEVFEKLRGFAQYGFPKSHAAAFALLAYQSCWLRYYYPAEFLCALLNNQPMGFYAPHVLINDAKRQGISVDRPDVNRSEARCTVEGERRVRIGLSFVKNVGEEVAQRLLAERRAGGPFQSLADTVRRVSMRPEAASALVAAGAFDGFGLRRRELLWQLGLFIPARGFGQKGQKRSRVVDAGKQVPLALPTAQDHVALPRTTAWERMADEYHVLGLSPRYHPLGLLRERLPAGMVSSQDLETLPNGLLIRISGLIVCRQRPGTAKGITFLLLEDEFGLVNIIVYPDLYERERMHVRATPLLIVEGRLQRLNNNTNVLAIKVAPLEDAPFAYPRHPSDAKEDPITDAADPRTIQLVQLDSSPTDGPRRRADITAIAPDSHNYR